MPSGDNSHGSDGDSIKVYLRIRPPDQDSGIDSGQILTVQPPNVVILPCKPEPKVFTFDHVADIHTTQEAVFAAVGRKTIESCVAGYNSTIFAYGQTGSGKTFTMLGSEEADNFHHELRGVIPRSFEYLFSLVNREREKQGERFEFLCRVSFLEIYNEQVFDLLDPASTGLQLRENFKRGVFVDGLIEQVVNNPSDAYQVLSAGWLNRRVASTSMNRESSRSHAVFTFSIQTKEKKAGVSNIRVSQLNLVDLAGSERQKDTKTCGLRLKEAGSINKSLLTLGHVITALVDIGHGKTRHVPYRDSKLSFLLRDSLGGNAKTYIIANVHPGAKCFGETLSTLNFARRAKMIKNKAVVNEDTQGNTLHLQAEIKRLREQLLQFTQGSIPRDLSNSAIHTPLNLPVTGSNTLAPTSNGEKKWRSHFLDAMYLREKVDNERKNLLEKISRLEDLSNKKEQYLQSTKMIVRFRENTIARLQKGQASGDGADNQQVSDMKNEIAALKQQLTHNPAVTQYAMENHNLRNENKKLMALQSVRAGVEYDSDRAQHLEKVFRELMASMEGGDRRTSVCPSPSRTPSQLGDHHAAVSSTFDKYKAQIKQMQAERDTARQELLEQMEVWEKTRLKLEAEAASCKKTIKELENALEAFKVKTKIERDTLNNLHMQTIMTIATPKKAAYNLRNRVVTVPSVDGTPVNPRQLAAAYGDSSPLRDQEGIVDEEIPEHMIEQCNEALAEEVKKLQEENSRLLQCLQDSETSHLKLKQTMSLLEHEMNQKDQLLESEQKQKMDFKAEATKLAARLEDLQKDYCIAKSEAEDMKIMLQSADKVMEEEKKQLQEAAVQRERSFAALESKVLHIELELSTTAREVETLTEEKRELQDASNTLQAEVNFKEQRQEELEAVIGEERGRIQTMADEIQSLMEKLDTELEKNARLSAEVREGSDSKRELLETLELTEQLREDNSKLQNLCSEKDAQLAKARDDLEMAMGTVSVLQKRAAEDKEALAGMVSTVQDLRQTIALKEDSLSAATSELEDARHRCESLQAAQDEYKNELQALQRELEEVTEEMASQSCAHNMEMEMLQEDLNEVRGQYESLVREMAEQERLIQATQAECEANAGQVATLKKQLVDKEDEMRTLEEVYETQLEEVKSNLSTVVVETDMNLQSQELKHTIDKQASEVAATLRTREQKLNEILATFEVMRETKNEEILQLKDSLEKLEHVGVEKEILAAKCQELEYKVEQWQDKANEKEMELQFSNRELREEVGRLNVAFDSVTKLKDEAVEAKLKAETEFAQLQCNSELMEENYEQILEELERTKALESGHFEEKENLKSCLGQLQEEKMQLLREMKRIEEKNEELTAINTKLAGHQNLKQKIHYHQQVKNENSQLKEQLCKTKSDSKLLKGELDQYKKVFGELKHNGGNGNGNGHGHSNGNSNGNHTLPLETVKENIDPRTVVL